MKRKIKNELNDYNQQNAFPSFGKRPLSGSRLPSTPIRRAGCLLAAASMMLAGCASSGSSAADTQETEIRSVEEVTLVTDKEGIETALNLDHMSDQEWTYDSATDSWTLTPVQAGTTPVLANQQRVASS